MSDNNIEVRVGAQTGELQDGMSRVTRVIADSMADIRQQFAGFSSMVSGLQSLLGGIALGALGKQAIDVMSSFEQLEIRLNSVMGSAEKGQEAFAWIKQFAQDTPFEVDQVTQSFMLLKNMGIDPMGGAMKAIADQAAKTGGGFETLQRISLALGQAWTKGKLQGEEAMQLLEAGVPVWDMLAKVTGKTTAEVQKLSEKGALGRDVMKALIDEIGRSSDGAAAAQMASLSGQMSNLADNTKGALDELRRAGGLTPFKEAVADLNTELDKLEKDGTINRWATNIAKAMRDIADATREAVGAIADAANLIASDIGRTRDSVAEDVDFITVSTQTLATLIAEAAYMVQTVWASFAGVMRDISAVITTVCSAVTVNIGTMQEVAGGQIEVLIGWMTALGRVASAVFSGDFAGAAAAWDEGLATVEKVVAKRAANIAKLAKDAQNATTEAWKNSGVMTAGGELDHIEKQYNTRLQRIFAPKAGYSNEGRGHPGAAPSAGGPTKPDKPPKLEGDDKKGKPPSQMSKWTTEIETKKNDYQIDNGLQQLSIADEIAFWQARKGEAKKGTDDLAAIERKLSGLRVQEMKDNLKTGLALSNAEIERLQKAGEDKIALARQDAQQQLALGNISQLQYLALEQDFEDQRYVIAKAALDARLALAEQDPNRNVAELAKLHAQLEAQEREHQQKLADIKGQTAIEQGKPGQKAWDGVESGMDSLYSNGLQRMLDGTLSFKQALQGVWAEIGKIMISNLVTKPAAALAAKYVREKAQEGAHQAALFAVKQGWLSRELAMKLGLLKAESAATAVGETAKTGAVVAGEAERTGATATGGLARLGLKAMETIKSIMMSAWEAMAGAFAAMCAIPVVGPALAVGAGAAALGLVVGIAGRVKSASGGYSIPRGVNPMTQLHEEEMVLPKPYANVIRDMAEGRQEGGSTAGGNAAPAPQFNIAIHAVDAPSVKRLFQDHGSALVSALKSQGRNFAGG